MATKHTREVAQYMKQQMSTEPAPVPPHWDLQLLMDCDHAVSIVKEAFANQRKFNYSFICTFLTLI